MPYAIQTRDRPGGGELRAELRPAHLEYLVANSHLILAGGALVEDDGTGGSGGIILLDTDDRAEAEAFLANDPFTEGGLFESATVTRWRKAFFNFEKLV